MTQETQLYALTVDGAVSSFQEMGLVTTIVAERTDGESQQALVMATADQVAKLRELIHVRELGPAEDGIYVDNLGRWHAIRAGEEIQSGRWLVPSEIVRSLGGVASSIAATPGRGASAERDPVCGMQLKPGQEEANVTYQGETYHFCSVECRELFLKDPTHYIKRPVAAAAPPTT